MEIEKAVRELQTELRGLGATEGSVIISTNVPPRSAFGPPRNNGYDVEDPGVAVYWTTKQHGERMLACDRWSSIRENLRAVGVAVHGLRLMERAGATQILERAFQAFGELPPASVDPVRPWWEVLGMPQDVATSLSLPMIEARYRELVTKSHPDKGGSPEALIELNRAIEDAREHYK